MPFCSNCGQSVQPADVFCAGCGSRQAGAAKAEGPVVSPKVASILCYVPMLGWIASIVILASDRFRGNRNVRFDAFQGLYLFVAWLVVDQVLGPLVGWNWNRFRFDKLLKMGIIATWIFMMIKASQERPYSLPLIGELAEKSAAE
ncbi:MAG: hypothetical protein ACRD96_03805 [Bryobacteraceae bacterium]